MIFEEHALLRMRMRGIPPLDAMAVVMNPQKVAPGHAGRTNYWGVGPSCRYRIRVTVNQDGSIRTVAWADPRKAER